MSDYITLHAPNLNLCIKTNLANVNVFINPFIFVCETATATTTTTKNEFVRPWPRFVPPWSRSVWKQPTRWIWEQPTRWIWKQPTRWVWKQPARDGKQAAGKRDGERDAASWTSLANGRTAEKSIHGRRTSASSKGRGSPPGIRTRTIAVSLKSYL